MTGSVIPTEVDQTVALEWLRYSLGQGEVISPGALKVVEERQGHSYTLAPDTVDPARLATPRYGGVAGAGGAQAALAKVLDGFAECGAACVVVEDEIRSKRDPKPSVDGLLRTAFVGELVVHWADLADGTEAAILTVHRGSGDYPTNVFVTSAPAGDLGLVDGTDLDSGIGAAVCGVADGGDRGCLRRRDVHDLGAELVWDRRQSRRRSQIHDEKSNGTRRAAR